MAQPITTTSATGTVVSVEDITIPHPKYARFGQTFSISVTVDNGGGTLEETTQTKPSVIVGDRVRVTITDGPKGKLMSEVIKI